MPDQTALEILKLELAGVEHRRECLITAIRALEESERTAVSSLAINSGPPIGPNDFRFMPICNAIVKYLYLAQRPAKLSSEVLPALERGGCNLGQESGLYARHLKTTVTTNSKKAKHPLLYEKETDIVRLRHSEKLAAQ